MKSKIELWAYLLAGIGLFLYGIVIAGKNEAMVAAILGIWAFQTIYKEMIE